MSEKKEQIKEEENNVECIKEEELENIAAGTDVDDLSGIGDFFKKMGEAIKKLGRQ